MRLLCLSGLSKSAHNRPPGPDDILAHTSLSIVYRKKGMIPEAEAEGNKRAFCDGSSK
jgi:hypothetical protein